MCDGGDGGGARRYRRRSDRGLLPQAGSVAGRGDVDIADAGARTGDGHARGLVGMDSHATARYVRTYFSAHITYSVPHCQWQVMVRHTQRHDGRER